MPNRILTREEFDVVIEGIVATWNAEAAYLRACKEQDTQEEQHADCPNDCD